METKIVYDTWLKYDEYEKAECDIKLHDGTILKHCWPNAGKFNSLCGYKGFSVDESEVSEIMYVKYYSKGLCDGNCNGESEEERNLNPKGSYIDYKNAYRDYGQAFWRSSHPPFVRSNPKVSRNEKCPCGSEVKYKKCCLSSGKFE
jgi:hypothetical protein